MSAHADMPLDPPIRTRRSLVAVYLFVGALGLFLGAYGMATGRMSMSERQDPLMVSEPLGTLTGAWAYATAGLFLASAVLSWRSVQCHRREDARGERRNGVAAIVVLAATVLLIRVLVAVAT